MAVTKNQLKLWFQSTLKPTQAQFAAWIDAMRHVDDKIAQSDLTTSLSDKIDSLPSTDVLNAAITAEATARAAADTTLQTNISNEVTTRAAADTVLATDIATKVSKWQHWEGVFIAKDATTGKMIFKADPANGLAQFGDFGNLANSTFISLDDNNGIILVNAANGVRGAGSVWQLDANGDAKFTNATITSLTSTMLKVNSAGKLVAAVAGTDYQAPIGYSPVNKAGDTMLGHLTLVGDAVNALHPITKSQFDNLQTGLSWKYSARASTVAALPAYTVSGDFLTLTAAANGALTLDGVTLLVGDRILVKNEAGVNRVNNGGYTVTQIGSASQPWIITRTLGVTTSEGLTAATFYIREGTIEANRIYAVNTNPVTLGTTQITFALVAGAGTYANGTGLDLTGNVFSISNGGVTNTMLAGAIADAKISSAANWNTAYNNRISNFTTTGNNGAATFAGNVLNIPTYTLSGLGGLPLVGGDLAGTAGSGFHGFISQSAAPATPSSGFRLYADASNRFAWKGANGFVRTFDGTSNTADRNYTLPDASGSLPLLSLAQTWSAIQTFSQPINALSTSGFVFYNTPDTTTNYERMTLGYITGSYRFLSEKGGTGTARNFSFEGGNVSIGGASPSQALSVTGSGIFSSVLYSPGLQNNSNNQNSQVNTGSTGASILRNIGDANPALIVRQQHASSTGDIQQWINNSSTVAKISQSGTFSLTKMQLLALNTAPASSSDTGTLGEIRITTDYIYVATAANTWKRAALITF